LTATTLPLLTLVRSFARPCSPIIARDPVDWGVNLRIREQLVRAAAVQLNSREDKRRNLAVAEGLVRDAARDGAELVVLPEKFNVLGTAEQMSAQAEPLDGPTLSWAGALATELGLWLVAGSIVERIEGEPKLRNTSALVGPDAEVHAVYRKIHMFDVDLGGTRYRESDSESPGEEIVLAEAAGLPLGLSVCYDLRFPELYRILAVRGARAIAVPAAFTLYTGKDHWEVLIRARAIENQIFVVAAGQIGEHPPDHRSYGRSMIVDPWGIPLAIAPDRECFIAADLDLEDQDRVRESLPSLANRRPAAYRWPEVVEAVG
jgi:predicted amidohydrolase